MSLGVRGVGRLDVGRARDLTEVTERGERVTFVDEPIDHVGAQEAGKDAHAFLTERCVAFPDDLARPHSERADRVAVEIDEVSRCGNGPKIRARSRASHQPRASRRYASIIPGPLAHRVEQGTFNPKVPGSSPGRPTDTTDVIDRSVRRSALG